LIAGIEPEYKDNSDPRYGDSGKSISFSGLVYIWDCLASFEKNIHVKSTTINNGILNVFDSAVVRRNGGWYFLIPYEPVEKALENKFRNYLHEIEGNIGLNGESNGLYDEVSVDDLIIGRVKNIKNKNLRDLLK
jgi:hypothetical protein